MRILHVSPITTKVPSGLTIYVIDLLKSVSKINSVKIALLPSYSDDRDLKIEGVLGFEPISNNHCNPWHIDEKYLKNVLKSFGQPDIVHFHSVYQPVQSALSIQLDKYKIPYISTMHGGFQQHSQQRKPLKKLLGNFFFFNSFIQRALAVHALNEAEVLAIRERFPDKKCFILPNGVSDRLLSSSYSHQSLNEMEGRVTFGFVGRIDMDHKGLDLFLHAVRKVQEQEPYNKLQFVFAGPFFGERNKDLFWKLVNALPNPEAVEYKGVISGDEKDKTFDRFDVFVHTSRHEGMPGAVLEAMARGIPCLVTPGTNVKDMVEHCNGGWGCALSVDSIAQAIVLISRQGSEMARKGEAARAYVLEKLTWTKISEQYVDELKTLLGM